MSLHARMRWLGIAALALVGAFAPACARRESSAPPHSADWVVGRSRPEFDPDGPSDPVRGALERLLTRSLMAEDSSGRIVSDAAEHHGVSDDGLHWTFVLRRGLRYADGGACTSRDFRDALLAGLRRGDHSTRSWLLSAVRGVEAVRVGRPLPPIGIEAPDDRTLTIHLVRPDPLIPAKLALPGVSAVWKSRAPGTPWEAARGLGAYRVADAATGRLRLVRVATAGPEAPDTLVVRFIPSMPRILALLRAAHADLVWPLPLGLGPIPAGFVEQARPARPARWLWLVMRADVPPTSKLATRHALAHAINRGELNQSLDPTARPGDAWLAGAAAFEFPKLDAAEVASWLDRAGLGRSIHVTLAYDAEGPAAAAARSMQGVASRLNIYLELKPLRDGAMEQEALSGTAQMLLVEAQPPFGTPGARVAQLVMPLRGPAVGAFRTGWRTREFDPWITPRGAAPPVPTDQVSTRLAEELIALPVAGLPWSWVIRSRGPVVRFHPRFGPEFTIVHDPAAGPLSH